MHPEIILTDIRKDQNVHEPSLKMTKCLHFPGYMAQRKDKQLKLKFIQIVRSNLTFHCPGVINSINFSLFVDFF